MYNSPLVSFTRDLSFSSPPSLLFQIVQFIYIYKHRQYTKLYSISIKINNNNNNNNNNKQQLSFKKSKRGKMPKKTEKKKQFLARKTEIFYQASKKKSV